MRPIIVAQNVVTKWGKQKPIKKLQRLVAEVWCELIDTDK